MSPELRGRERFLRVVFVLAVLSLGVDCALVEPSLWLNGCATTLNSGSPATLKCTIKTHVSFDPISTNVDLSRPLVVEGVGAQTLNLSNAIGLFSVKPGAAVTIRQLQLVDVALNATFLALLAFSFANTTATANSQQPSSPRLSLNDVAITTRNCTALAFQQRFACSTSPSPNFTIAPGELVVHEYTSATVQARNVTLRCSTVPSPPPCRTLAVSSATELVNALIAAANPEPMASVPPVDLRAVPLYMLITRSLRLWDAWDDAVPEHQQPTGSLQIYARPLVLSGGNIAASAPGGGSGSYVRPPVVLDLFGTFKLFTLSRPADRGSSPTIGARIELHNLTIVNPPLGPANEYPSALLALPLWSFDVGLSRLGVQETSYMLKVRGLAVELASSELALWHQDVLGSVPEELAAASTAFCAYSNEILMPDSDSGMGLGSGEQLAGGGLYIVFLRSIMNHFRQYEQTLLLPAPPPQNLIVSRSPPATAGDEQPAPDSSHQATSAATVPAVSTGTTAGGTHASSSDASGTQAASNPSVSTFASGTGSPLLATVAAASSVTASPVAAAASDITAAATPDPFMVASFNTAASSRSALQTQERPPLCQFRPEADNSTAVALWDVTQLAGRLRVTSFTASKAFTGADSNSSSNSNNVTEGFSRVYYYVFTGDAVLLLEDDSNTFLHAQAPVLGLTVILGDPQGPRLLHMSYAPATMNVRAAPDASLTLRQLVLSGLPPAGLHPSSAAWENSTGVQGHGNGSWTAPAGVSATGGLATAYTNFTSCLWPLDFDRGSVQQQQPAGGYRVFLDSVVLLVPPGELALMAWVWAEHLASTDQQQQQQQDEEGASGNGANGSSSRRGGNGYRGPAPTLLNTSTYTAADFEVLAPSSQRQEATSAASILRELRAMPQASRLSAGAFTAASLKSLTARLMNMEAARQQQLQQLGTFVEAPSGSSIVSMHWWQASTGSGSSSQPPIPASLSFAEFCWCGLTGRNVTLAAEPPPSLNTSIVPSLAQLWIGRQLDLPLLLAPRQPQQIQEDTAATPPPQESLVPTLQPAPSLPPPSVVLSEKQLVPVDVVSAGGEPNLGATTAGAMAAAATTPARHRPPNPMTVQPALVGAVAGGVLLCLVAALAAALLWFRRRQQQQRQPSRPTDCTDGTRAETGPLGSATDVEKVADAGPASSPGVPLVDDITPPSVALALTSMLCEINSLHDDTAVVPTAAAALPISKTSDGHGASSTASDRPCLKGAEGEHSHRHQQDEDSSTAGSSNEGYGSSSGGVGSSNGSGNQQHGPVLVLLGELCRGAQGIVYRGRWRSLDVAVKRVLFRTDGADTSAAGGSGGDSTTAGHCCVTSPRSPILEAAITSSLNHPNVLATYTHQLCRLDSVEQEPQQQPEMPLPQPPQSGQAAAVVEGQVWRLTLVTELCDAGSLRQCLDSGILAACSMTATAAVPGTAATTCLTAQQPSRGPPPPAAVGLAVALHVARGLEYLHSVGVLHGDLSSANVLLQSCTKPQPPKAPPAAPLRPPPAEMQLPTPLLPLYASTAGPEPPATTPFWAQLMGVQGAAPPQVCIPPLVKHLQQQQQQQRHPWPLQQAGSGAAGHGGGVSSSGGKPYSSSRGGSTAGNHASSSSTAAHRPGHCWFLYGSRLYGYGYVAKVADFGLSGRLQGDDTHLSGEARRSSLYSAPELVQYGTCNKGTDVYAFAVLLYEVVAGRSLQALLREPQAGAGLRDWLMEQQQPQAAAVLPPSLLVWPGQAPSGVARLAAECLAADPAARPSFSAICLRLQQLLGEMLHAASP